MRGRACSSDSFSSTAFWTASISKNSTYANLKGGGYTLRRGHTHVSLRGKEGEGGEEGSGGTKEGREEREREPPPFWCPELVREDGHPVNRSARLEVLLHFLWGARVVHLHAPRQHTRTACHVSIRRGANPVALFHPSPSHKGPPSRTCTSRCPPSLLIRPHPHPHLHLRIISC